MGHASIFNLQGFIGLILLRAAFLSSFLPTPAFYYYTVHIILSMNDNVFSPVRFSSSLSLRQWSGDDE
jgi:hypothetical protein